MCVLCGALWSRQRALGRVAAEERSEAPDGVVRRSRFTSTSRGQRLRDQARRAVDSAACFAGYGLQYQDWEGSSYIVRDAKGNTAMAPDLAALLPAAEKFSALPRPVGASVPRQGAGPREDEWIG